MVLTIMHLGSDLTTRNDLSNSQVLQSICPRNEGIDGPRKTRPQKKSIRSLYLIVNLNKFELA